MKVVQWDGWPDNYVPFSIFDVEFDDFTCNTTFTPDNSVEWIPAACAALREGDIETPPCEAATDQGLCWLDVVPPDVIFSVYRYLTRNGSHPLGSNVETRPAEVLHFGGGIEHDEEYGTRSRDLTNKGAFLASCRAVRECVSVSVRAATWVGKFAGSGRWRGAWACHTGLGRHLLSLTSCRFLQCLDLSQVAPSSPEPAEHFLPQVSLLRSLKRLEYIHRGRFTDVDAYMLARCAKLETLRVCFVIGSDFGISRDFSLKAFSTLPHRIRVELELSLSAHVYEKIHAKTCAYETCIGPNLADACGANIQSMRAEIKDVPSAWRQWDASAAGQRALPQVMTDISGVAKGARAVHVSLVSCAGVRFDCVGAVPNVETLEAAHCWAEACVLGDNHVAAVLCGLPTLRQVVLRACHWEDHRGPRVLESDVPISETLSLWRFRRNLDGISNKAVRLLAIM